MSLRSKSYENFEQAMLHNHALQGALVEHIAEKLGYDIKVTPDAWQRIRKALYDASVATAKLPIEVAASVNEFLISLKAIDEPDEASFNFPETDFAENGQSLTGEEDVSTTD